MSKWISITEDLPELGTLILAYHKNSKRIEIEKRYGKTGFAYSMLYGPVSHWMPLPEPPEGTQIDNRKETNK